MESSGLQQATAHNGSQALGIRMGIDELRAWLRSAPPGTTLSASALVELLEADIQEEHGEPVQSTEPVEITWRELLWLVPSETRINTSEVLEAIGRSRSWLYGRMASEHGSRRFPHRKLDGELCFVAGEVRAWLRSEEDVLVAGPMDSTDTERRLTLVRGDVP